MSEAPKKINEKQIELRLVHHIGFEQTISLNVPFKEIEGHSIIKRNGLFYTMSHLSNDRSYAIFIECITPFNVNSLNNVESKVEFLTFADGFAVDSLNQLEKDFIRASILIRDNNTRHAVLGGWKFKMNSLSVVGDVECMELTGSKENDQNMVIAMVTSIIK